MVYPQLREQLKNDERKIRLYKIILSRYVEQIMNNTCYMCLVSNRIVHADYMTFELEESAWKPSDLKQFIPTSSGQEPVATLTHTVSCVTIFNPIRQN